MFELHSDREQRPYHFKERYLLFSKIIFSDLTSKRWSKLAGCKSCISNWIFCTRNLSKTAVSFYRWFFSKRWNRYSSSKFWFFLNLWFPAWTLRKLMLKIFSADTLYVVRLLYISVPLNLSPLSIYSFSLLISFYNVWKKDSKHILF